MPGTIGPPLRLMRIPGPTHRGPILLQHRREHLQARGHDQLLELGLSIDKGVDQREMTRCRGCRLATTSDYARLLLHGGSFLGASPQVFPTGRITRPAGSRRLKFQQPLGHPLSRWAEAYERQQGRIRCPRRVEHNQDRRLVGPRLRPGPRRPGVRRGHPRGRALPPHPVWPHCEGFDRGRPVGVGDGARAGGPGANSAA